MGDMRLKRDQAPVTPAFALTDYKVLGSTYKNAVLDLRCRTRPSGEEAKHKRYCTVNVQLSRLKSKSGIRMLQPITLSDLNIQMHPELYEEDRRLQQLAAETILVT
jgi:hypothetical protein